MGPPPGEIVPVQILGPALIAAGALEWGLGVCMWRPQGIQRCTKVWEDVCVGAGESSVVYGHADAVSVTGVSVPRKGEASLSHLKSGLRFTPRPHPDLCTAQDGKN